MDRNEKLNEFLGSLISCAVEAHETSKEYTFEKQRQEEIKEIIISHFNEIQRSVVYDILIELEAMYELQNEVIYRQGLKDCAWLLKNLGVLA